jgi:hypothetical protein
MPWSSYSRSKVIEYMLGTRRKQGPVEVLVEVQRCHHVQHGEVDYFHIVVLVIKDE